MNIYDTDLIDEIEEESPYADEQARLDAEYDTNNDFVESELDDLLERAQAVGDEHAIVSR